MRTAVYSFVSFVLNTGYVVVNCIAAAVTGIIMVAGGAMKLRKLKRRMAESAVPAEENSVADGPEKE